MSDLSNAGFSQEMSVTLGLESHRCVVDYTGIQHSLFVQRYGKVYAMAITAVVLRLDVTNLSDCLYN